MMEGPPDKVEEIFRDFMKRRAGLIKALTSGIFLFSPFLGRYCINFSVFFFF